MRQLIVVGVRIDLPDNAPVLLLKDAGGPRLLPIWVSATDAAAIADAVEDAELRRPGPHDLVVSLLERLGTELVEVRLTGVEDGIFEAELDLGLKGTLATRPSDAVALALRLGAPIFCAEGVLDAAGIELAGSQDAEVEAFREFLANVDVEDFRP